MLRLLVTSKWLGLTSLLLVSVGGFLWLGAWQWSRAQDQPSSADAISTVPAVSLASVYSPGEPVPRAANGQLVRVSGEYNAAAQLLVPHPMSSEAHQFWILTPLELPDGSVLPIVRGWSAQSSGPGLVPPTGRVVVSGRLQPPESDSLRAQSAEVLPVGQIAIVSSAELLSLWEGDLFQGFVVLEEQRPASALPAVAPPATAAAPGVSWQNLAYAIQWWLFAAFAIFFWWRMFQIDWADGTVDPPPSSSPDLTEARS